jgi:hypothetical protein
MGRNATTTDKIIKTCKNRGKFAGLGIQLQKNDEYHGR